MIRIVNLSQIEIDGANAGDIASVAFSHPDLLSQVAAELKAYESHLINSGNQQSNVATIAHLTARIQALAPSLAEILPALLEAGLTAWADRAVTTYNESHLEGADSLMPTVAQLYAAASSNDIAAVPPLFGKIMQRSMVAPTADEATAMQAVLDGVQFPPELINFYPWIEQ